MQSLGRHRARSRKVDVVSFDQKPLSDWTKWSERKATEKAECRANPDRDSLRRVLRAPATLAQACGARATIF